jgi:hypothetical protein
MMQVYLTHLLLQSIGYRFISDISLIIKIHNPLITRPLSIGSLIVPLSYLLLEVPIVAGTV